CMQAVESPWTF
nr:immunoglobulin light chain junction region [Macaca mulatta]